MAAPIYKPRQGYWTRLMSAIGLGLLALMGAKWIWDNAKTIRIEGVEPVYISATAASIFIAVFAILGLWFIALKPRSVDFMIATESEMKKVDWSTPREIFGSTWVVVALTFLIAALIFVVDLAFQNFFQWVGVLEAIE